MEKMNESESADIQERDRRIKEVIENTLKSAITNDLNTHDIVNVGINLIQCGVVNSGVPVMQSYDVIKKIIEHWADGWKHKKQNVIILIAEQKGGPQ